MAKVNITKFISSPSEPNGASHRVTLVASGVGMPSEVFVLHKPAPGTVRDQARLEAIATPLTLDLYPTEPPLPEDEQVFYRTDKIDLLFHDAGDEMVEVIDDIIEDVSRLVAAYNALLDTSLAASYEITKNGVAEATVENGGLSRLGIEWRPAGSPAVGSDNSQSILSPDASSAGWLPVSEYSGTAPAGAVFFYNKDEHPAASILFGTIDTQESPFPVLSLNNTALPESVFSFQDGNLFWNDFAPESLSINFDGNAPWPTDYAGPNYFPQQKLEILTKN